ncbi:MAG: ECF RNA polymerase sigma factor SigE [Phycisphaerae bacterium]|nr:ECF RNA polymerase sigma factor SigE [Phycisphaerae bacterium]
MAEMDIQLLRRAVDGDALALSELLAQHGPAVEKTLRIEPLWRSQIDSADVMQVTYIEAFRHIREFDPGRAERFESWLRQMAENNLRDAIRGLTRQKRGGAAEPGAPGIGAMFRDDAGLLLAATSATPSRAARRDDRAEKLRSALEKLPPDYSQVVRLADLEGRPVGDVAAAMGRSPGSIHMLRARAHDRLRELLGPASEFLTSA